MLLHTCQQLHSAACSNVLLPVAAQPAAPSICNLSPVSLAVRAHCVHVKVAPCASPASISQAAWSMPTIWVACSDSWAAMQNLSCSMHYMHVGTLFAAVRMVSIGKSKLSRAELRLSHVAMPTHSLFNLEVHDSCPSSYLPDPGMRTRAAAGQTTSSLQEIDSDNYDQVLKDAGDKLVVIDFYTQWWVLQLGRLCAGRSWHGGHKLGLRYT